MLIHLKNVLGSRDIKHVHELLSNAEYVDGKLSAGKSAATVKNNLELSATQSTVIEQLNQKVMGNLVRHKTYQRAALPLKVASPFYACYETGMSYGEHIDDPIMGGQARYRSDLAVTIFLNAPEEYDGGELEIHTAYGPQSIKYPAGDAVLYPATTRHAVKTVTRGKRYVAVTWVQSLVRDLTHRQILFELSQARERLLREQPQEGYTQQIDWAYVNLVREWSDC
jgi:PKHD-type hydroxylase